MFYFPQNNSACPSTTFNLSLPLSRRLLRAFIVRSLPCLFRIPLVVERQQPVEHGVPRRLADGVAQPLLGLVEVVTQVQIRLAANCRMRFHTLPRGRVRLALPVGTIPHDSIHAFHMRSPPSWNRPLLSSQPKNSLKSRASTTSSPSASRSFHAA